MFIRELRIFNDIKNDPFIKENIIWDLEPCELMKPRRNITDEGIKYRELIKGYIFYIDTLSKKPTLFLMQHTANDCGVTYAIIDEVPEELIADALEENKNKGYFGMFPINSKIEDWLKKEMGIKNN